MEASERLVEMAQALLTGYDTALSRGWRDEDRAWRKEDMAFREREAGWAAAQHAFLDEQRAWREADVEQRHLDNARVLWARVVEKNRRDVEEKGEQLRSISTQAALIAGFALTSFLQFDFGTFQDTTGVCFPLFGVTMALTVGSECICVIICSLMLVSVYKTGQNYMSDEEEAEFIARCRAFLASYAPGDTPPAPARSFAMHWQQRCEASWRRAFLLFGAGLPCLFANLSVAAWIKFDTSLLAAVLTTVVMALSLLAMAHFHRKWSAHILATERSELAGAQRLPLGPPAGMPWDWSRPPLRYARTASHRIVPLDAACNGSSAPCSTAGGGVGSRAGSMPTGAATPAGW